MKKLLALAFVLTAFLSFVACTSAHGPSTTSPAPQADSSDAHPAASPDTSEIY